MSAQKVAAAVDWSSTDRHQTVFKKKNKFYSFSVSNVLQFNTSRFDNPQTTLFFFAPTFAGVQCCFALSLSLYFFFSGQSEQKEGDF